MNSHNIQINDETSAYLANVDSFEVGEEVTAIAKDENGMPFEITGILTEKF